MHAYIECMKNIDRQLAKEQLTTIVERLGLVGRYYITLGNERLGYDYGHNWTITENKRNRKNEQSIAITLCNEQGLNATMISMAIDLVSSQFTKKGL